MRVRGVEPPARREDRARRGGGRDLGAVPPREPGEEHRGGYGERAVDDHDGLQAGAAGAAGLPADLPVGAHARRLVRRRGAGGVEFVAQVAERVGLALGVGARGSRGSRRAGSPGPAAPPRVPPVPGRGRRARRAGRRARCR